MEKEKMYLGKHALILRDYMKDVKPKLYRDMKKSGKLNAFLGEREGRYLEQISHFMKQGLNMAEARELAWGDLMSLPGVEE